MTRIAGIDIPDNKRIEIALTYIYGIGRSRAEKILTSVGINFDLKVNKLTPEQVNKIKNFIEKNYKIEGDLRRAIAADVKRLREIKAYRGYRHSRRLPVRGQRTKTNSRTVRGNVKRTMSSGRRKIGKK